MHIEGRAPVTDQEAFNIMAAHLLRQAARSRLGERCAYRGDGGRKCAIGILIPDDQYRDDFENRSVSELMVDEGLPCLHGLTLALLKLLQAIHDYSDPIDWPLELASAAEGCGLNFDRAMSKGWTMNTEDTAIRILIEQRKKNDAALEVQLMQLAAEVARLTEELRVANADIARYVGEWL
jgi:hypothetical protein